MCVFVYRHSSENIYIIHKFLIADCKWRTQSANWNMDSNALWRYSIVDDICMGRQKSMPNRVAEEKKCVRIREIKIKSKFVLTSSGNKKNKINCVLNETRHSYAWNRRVRGNVERPEGMMKQLSLDTCDICIYDNIDVRIFAVHPLSTLQCARLNLRSQSSLPGSTFITYSFRVQ